MSNDEFLNSFFAIFERALSAYRLIFYDGILALEKSIDNDKAANRDIFEYGMQLVVDGAEYSVIDIILSNIIKHEKDEQAILLKTIQKEAVLAIDSN